ncbi:MAG: hypothetical protein F2667_09335 [Actinobacteria bacterium]|uniref:Unannotated protein n=1 Tax=freshwater metagenome TaxID=449393 RepID=A0A6J6R0R7_9ZZZZ|nr:hypothetical protein [Actinomycetota bacterium]
MRSDVHRRGTAGPVAALLSALLLSACEASPVEETSSQEDLGSGTSAVRTAADPTTITLAFAGDVHFEGALTGEPRRPGATLGPMSQALRAADLAVVNLESAITTRGSPARKELEAPTDRYWFRSAPAALGVLARSGVDVVTVANNHGADYGVPGIRDTLRAAASAPVGVIGVGLDEEQAYAPHRVSVRGTEVAVLAADASRRESADPAWAVAPGSGPGLASARGPRAEQLVASVRAAAAEDDVVGVYLHWGEESNACPTTHQQSLSRLLSDAGADVVVGSHAHVPLGAGMLDGTYVSYGLGNFYWYHGHRSETGVLQVSLRAGEVVDDTWTPALIPTAGGDPQPLRGTARDDAVADWRSLRGCTDLAPGPGARAQDAAGAALPAFASTVRRIGPALRRTMTSHDPATCPVPLADLRHLTLSYVGFDGRSYRGQLVVAAEVASDVLSVFAALYESRFPIQRMRLIDAYDGDDELSMAANNTSAYNCRTVAGTDRWSDHAYGRAIDINPLQNPYVVGETVLPRAGRAFVSVDRTRGARTPAGVIHEGDVAHRAFERLGWSWGGFYTDPDYQHFSAP